MEVKEGKKEGHGGVRQGMRRGQRKGREGEGEGGKEVTGDRTGICEVDKLDWGRAEGADAVAVTSGVAVKVD